MNTFMPEGVEHLKTDKKYLSLSKLPEGDIKLRIVTKPIAGWIDWKDNKPMRFRPHQRPKVAVDPEKPIRSFWAFYVWDYSKEDLFLMEVTQSSILKALHSYGNDEDWGDFTKYDIKITKKGSGKETEYFVTPLPHKPIAEKILIALAATPVRLEALYEGRDPWNDMDALPETQDVSHLLTEEQCAQLDDLITQYPAGEKKICELLNIGRIYDMPASEFDRTVTYFNNNKGNKNAKSKVA